MNAADGRVVLLCMFLTLFFDRDRFFSFFNHSMVLECLQESEGEGIKSLFVIDMKQLKWNQST